jgi:hypothetical protein
VNLLAGLEWHQARPSSFAAAFAKRAMIPKRLAVQHINQLTDSKWNEADAVFVERQDKTAVDVRWNPVTRKLEIVYEQAVTDSEQVCEVTYVKET